MEFVNAINNQEDSHETVSDTSAVGPSMAKENLNDGVSSAPMEEPLESFLGKGKSRVIFYLLLNMARAEIFLMKENDSKLATLAQDNFLTDIKVHMPILLSVCRTYHMIVLMYLKYFFSCDRCFLHLLV